MLKTCLLCHKVIVFSILFATKLNIIILNYMTTFRPKIANRVFKNEGAILMREIMINFNDKRLKQLTF